MDTVSPLYLVQTRTCELVALDLRSVSMLIARLSPLIDDAHRLGHSHRSIHAAIDAGGLTTSWNNYRVYLARARKARRIATIRPIGPVAEQITPDALPAAEPAPAQCGADSATRVLDALASARRAASRDYARIGRGLYRKDPL